MLLTISSCYRTVSSGSPLPPPEWGWLNRASIILHSCQTVEQQQTCHPRTFLIMIIMRSLGEIGRTWNGHSSHTPRRARQVVPTALSQEVARRVVLRMPVHKMSRKCYRLPILGTLDSPRLRLTPRMGSRKKTQPTALSLPPPRPGQLPESIKPGGVAGGMLQRTEGAAGESPARIQGHVVDRRLFK